MTPLHQHLSPVLATALARQLALADLLDDRSWNVDISAGTVTFGTDLRYPIQLLGTEGEAAGTWMWAWANEQSNLPPQLVRAAEWIRGYGRQHGIAELTEPEVPLDRADGHLLSLFTAGRAGRPYYRGPYPGGALFFIVEQAPDAFATPVSPLRVTTVLGQAIQLYGVEHRPMTDAFLRAAGYEVTVDADRIEGRHPDGTPVSVRFDGLGRISGIESSMTRQ